MKISILLPFKENFSPQYAGDVSLNVKDTTKYSIYRKKITVYGSTKYRKKYNITYKNLQFKKKIFRSNTKSYLLQFINEEIKKESDLIEVHNRPEYINFLSKFNLNLVLFFHNDPLSMNKSKSIKDRNFLLLKTKKIIFNSNWTKKRFLTGLKSNKSILKKISVIHQSTDKVKVNLNKKKKIIIFIGRLNSSKGYDLFGHAIIKILNKYKDWKSLVIGDEHREKLYFNHPNLIVLGFQNHKKTLNYLKYSSISVVCSKWDEPFGRTALEASSRGCAVIISNKGGLPEAVTDSLKINKLSVNSVYNAIDKLINNSKLRTTLQKKSLNNFYLNNKFISKKIDDYRFNILKT